MQLRRFAFCLVTTFFGPVVLAYAQDQDPPLFAAFKTYCLKAGADADQVKLGVELLGGKTHNPPGGTTDTPWPMTLASWDITVKDHRMTLSIGTAHPPHGSRMVSNSTSCVINSFSDESVSMDSLRKWVAVPRDPDMSFPEFYTFRQDGIAHKPIENDDSRRTAEENGNLWQLVLIGKNSVQFVHTLPPTPKAPN
ncbi:MAG TPA: hypothetical protein VFC44_14300 [Candidatus Saccharimonadales bacterium]|nr:hypothetical protein [Candidatus Saccharimonadales bacterium]